jgi:hypothetical protein
LGERGIFFSGLVVVVIYFIFGISEFFRNYLFEMLKFKEITREGNIYPQKFVKMQELLASSQSTIEKQVFKNN